MSDLREAMTQAIESEIKQLAHVRQCREVDAAVAVAQTYAVNLRDSRGTSMEPYWEAMSSIVDGMAAFRTGSR